MGIANDLAMEFMLPRVQGEKVLDVGCRDSDFPIILDQRGHKVWAVDIDKAAIDRLKAKRVIIEDDYTFFVAETCDARVLHYAANQFDTVTAIFALQHITDGTDIQAYQECARVLKPGGRLLLVQSHAKETRHDFERVDPQRINSTADVFERIIKPTGLKVIEIESFAYSYEQNTGHWESLERSNAICLHLQKEL